MSYYPVAILSSLDELFSDLRHHSTEADVSASRKNASSECFARRLNATIAVTRGSLDWLKLGRATRELKTDSTVVLTPLPQD